MAGDFMNDIARFCNNALNRTLTRTARAQRQLIRERYSFSNKTIRRFTKTRRSRVDTLEVTIRNSPYKLSLNNFKRLERRGGVLVKLSKNHHIMVRGGFLAARRGETKARNKGFLATRTLQSFPGITTTSGRMTSYKHHKTPMGSQVYYFKTKPFNLIAREQNGRLLSMAYRYFAEELARE